MKNLIKLFIGIGLLGLGLAHVDVAVAGRFVELDVVDLLPIIDAHERVVLEKKLRHEEAGRRLRADALPRRAGLIPAFDAANVDALWTDCAAGPGEATRLHRNSP